MPLPSSSAAQSPSPFEHDVIVIGAGPSGAIASALLRRKGYRVLVIERQTFPRFSIGESLLAHCIDFIEQAGMLDAVKAAGFQLKNGAAFAWGDRQSHFDFRDKFTPGHGTTFQVQRAHFDQVLADEASRQGVEIRYAHEVTAAHFTPECASLDVRPLDGGEPYSARARFVLDGSGYGRVLSRLLDLETPSSMPPRRALFTHIEDRIACSDFDRDKILITVHPQRRGVWYWLIPFSNGRSSLGVVAEQGVFDDAMARGVPLADQLRDWAQQAPGLKRHLAQASWDTPVNTLGGYSANVKTLYGTGYALLGNAAEFLDPVFSSGVTIAMHSAGLAVEVLDRQLKGQAVDWEGEFAVPLKRGVDTFRTYVEGWYDGSFQDVVFYEKAQVEVRRMICSILAGYAWDLNNPYVSEPRRRLQTLARLCAA